MYSNPIVDEVHRIREQLLAEYNGDLRALMKDVRRRTEEAGRAGHPIYSPKKSEIKPDASAHSKPDVAPKSK